jgi:hypothetical protein
MTDELPMPKRRRRWLALVFAALLLMGGLFLVTREAFHSRAARLRPGLTKTEVIAVMGEPDRLMRLGDVEIALFTPLPFDLHALFTKPAQTLAGQPLVVATEFPAYVEFRGDIATRVRVEGRDIKAVDGTRPQE